MRWFRWLFLGRFGGHSAAAALVVPPGNVLKVHGEQTALSVFWDQTVLRIPPDNTLLRVQ